MKNTIILTAAITLIMGVSQNTIAANVKKMPPAGKPVVKEEMDVVKSKAITKENIATTVKIDTVYVNGEASLLSYSLSTGKDKRLFSVHNLNNEMVAYIVKMNYLNGRTYYQVNFPQTKQSTYGAIYETVDALIEIISNYVSNGKVTQASVAEIAQSNKFVLKENVEFKAPQGNLDDIQRAFYDVLNKGKNQTTTASATPSTPVVAAKQTVAAPAAAPVASVEAVNANGTSITLKNYSTSNHTLIFNRKMNNQVATDKTTINAGASSTFVLNANDEVILADAKGHKISTYTLKAGVRNLVISADGKNIRVGKTTVVNDVAMAR